MHLRIAHVISSKPLSWFSIWLLWSTWFVAKNFRKYVLLHIIPFFESEMSDCTQLLDAVWDTYPDENLKVLTQQKCGNGARIKVGYGSAPITRHEWNIAFLKNEDNKKELIAFISKELSATKVIGRLLLSTHLETVILISANLNCAITLRLTQESSCILHMLQNKDTHIFTVLVCLNSGWDLVVENTIMTFQSMQYVQLSLRLYLSFTVFGCGKKTACVSLPNLTDTLIKLTQYPHRFTLESEYMAIKMFHFDHVQQGMWCKECEWGKESLTHHWTKITRQHSTYSSSLIRACKMSYSSSKFYWSQAIVQQNIPNFSEWGWNKDSRNKWQPLWTTLSDASEACSILLHCGVYKGMHRKM